ncbi:MAG: hypothetical protein KDC26_06160, partial [Armatimonadetes bacterium]|nr:hypothetical protein [Armatimonadota bacterium]
IQPSRGNFSDNIIYRPGAAFIFGPGAFGWFDGHQEEGCRVRFEHDLPVHCTLKKSGDWFTAPHYWELLDSPIVVGSGVKVTTRNVGSAKHEFVAFGNIEGLDIEPFGNMVQKITMAGLELFGKLPYEHYIFFGDFGGFAAGLEHANSNRIGYWTNNANNTRGIMFHEYFHAFNVKRVRPKSLVNPDFTKAPTIDSLWWLEGVTDYYASILELRAGLNSQENFLASMGNGSQILNGKQVALRDSSRRVWEQKGSQGYSFSYYAGGRYAGFVFDTAVRVESQNKYSLDNVMLDLFKECGDTKGYDESRIKELIVKYGGEKMGPLYEGLINSPGGVDVSSWMTRAGLVLNGRRLTADPNADETAVNTRKLLGYSLNVKM